MEHTLIIWTAINSVVTFLLIILVVQLKVKSKHEEIESVEQINLTLKSIDTEILEIKKDLYKTLSE